MGTAILTTAGAEVGETLVGHADFQLSDNVIQKMHYGNFTFYAKSLVYYPEKVLIVTDIISKRYIMGNDMTFFDKRSLDSFMSGQNGSEHKRSILVFAVPADQRREGMYEYDNPLDLTGKYADHLEMLGAQNNNGQRLMFSSAGWYGAHYNMQNNQHSNQDRDYFGYFPRAQSLCYQVRRARAPRMTDGDSNGGYSERKRERKEGTERGGVHRPGDAMALGTGIELAQHAGARNRALGLPRVRGVRVRAIRVAVEVAARVQLLDVRRHGRRPIRCSRILELRYIEA